MNSPLAPFAAILVLLVMLTAPVAGVLAPIHDDIESSGGDADRFGSSVALDGGMMAVGVPGTGHGKVQIFAEDNGEWVLRETVLAPDGADGDGFGRAVALRGEWLLVGAPTDENGAPGAGSAYLFKWGGADWSEPAKFVGAAGIAGASFGISVALGDDLLVVGAPSAGESGAAYVYGTLEEPHLLATLDPGTTAGFGRSVAIDGAKLLVGANRDSTRGPDAGAVYAYSGSGNQWNLDAILTTTHASSNAWLGTSVAISGDTAVAGAYRASADGVWAGAAYIFERGEGFWSLTTRLGVPDPDGGEFFGYSVDIDGAGVAVGAPAIGSGAGAAYLLTRDGTGWTAPLRVESDARHGDEYGASVALGGGLLAVGAPRGTVERAGTAGAVDMFEVDLDGDGVTDRAEWDQGTDHLNPDTDGDGLSDGAEAEAGTDPLDEDSDDDTLSDGEEVNEYGTDPLEADTDLDFYSDAQEVACGSDPASEDDVPPTKDADNTYCLVPDTLVAAA